MYVAPARLDPPTLTGLAVGRVVVVMVKGCVVGAVVVVVVVVEVVEVVQ